MAKNRQLYQSDLIYVGPTGAYSATGQHYTNSPYGLASGDLQASSGANLVAELFRVQTANYNWARTLQDVNQFGELAAIDRVSIVQPTVGLDISWLVASLTNEKLMGLTISSGTQISCISGILNTSTDVKNYFIETVAEGSDVVNLTSSTSSVVGIGNGFISNYTAQGSVGNFPTASARIEALNFQVTTANTGVYIPAVNPTDGTAVTGYYFSLPVATQNPGGGTINADNLFTSVLRPGDIVVNLGTNAGDGQISEGDMKAQSYNLSFDLRRTDLQKLGSKYAYAKVIQFPVTATMSVNVVVGDYQTGTLVEIINNNNTFNPSVTIYGPGEAKVRSNIQAYYQLKGAKLQDQQFTSSIGPSKTATMTFSAQIGGPNQNTIGVFLSGVA